MESKRRVSMHEKEQHHLDFWEICAVVCVQAHVRRFLQLKRVKELKKEKAHRPSFGINKESLKKLIRSPIWTSEEVKANAELIFDTLDDNQSGDISPAELGDKMRMWHTLHEDHNRMNLFEEMKLFHELDSNGDSSIEKDEFVQKIAQIEFSPEKMPLFHQVVEMVQVIVDNPGLESKRMMQSKRRMSRNV
mmetsp:Transcript_733/g.939  ORF Transcript_733/g.939 Transcript_733/m.939 type:complete len:191 (-) Transcript_733:455-1027(-)